MIETHIIAYDYRCNMLYAHGVGFDIFWENGVAYFSFYNDLNMREALDLINMYG